MAEIEKRWFCRWTVGATTVVVAGQSFKTLPEALDEAERRIKAVGKNRASAVIVFHDQDADQRMRWSRKLGYEHMTPYVRDYLKGLLTQ